MKLASFLSLFALLFLMNACVTKSKNATSTEASSVDIAASKSLISNPKKQVVTFPSLDGLMVTADYYSVGENTPLLLLCHQANWSRGEYQEIIPKLNALGYSCLAIDQRSGKEINGVPNETAKLAKEKNKPTQYVDAEQDIIAAVRYAATKSNDLTIWGSSYSAGLVLKVAQDEKAVKRVLSFSPGEYYGDFLDLKSSINKLEKPVFVTCSKDEVERTQPIFDVMPSENKTFFKPETKGNHGSRALFERFSDNDSYWKAVKSFLKN